jgi:hypothetical protein
MSVGEWSERSWDAKPSKRFPDPDTARAVPDPAVRAAEAIEIDDLVDVLADGLFEMVLNGDAPISKRRRAKQTRPSA